MQLMRRLAPTTKCRETVEFAQQVTHGGAQTDCGCRIGVTDEIAGNVEGKMKRVGLLVFEKRVCTGLETAPRSNRECLHWA
jgi:hypothetical protein